MAQRRRDDGADAVQMQPSPSPSLLSLPDIAHSCITSFLRDGNKGNDSRLRVAEASRVAEALRHGALHNLLELEMEYCFAGDGTFQRIIAALAGSACSKRLLRLFFDRCEIKAEGVCVWQTIWVGMPFQHW